MKTKITFLIVLISSISVFGQNFEKLLYSKKDKSTVLINENIIANWDMLQNPTDLTIKEMMVLKPKQKEVDEHTKNHRNLSQYGLILCKAEVGNMETKTQNDLRTFFGADSKTKIYVDGFLLMNDNYVIATKSIKEIEFISPNEQDLNENKIINVWTLTKDTRLGSLDLRKNK